LVARTALDTQRFGRNGLDHFALRGTAGFADPAGMASKLIELGLMNVLWADRGSAGI
jgi:hypothetical protein